MNLLLLSNSTAPGRAYLAHAQEPIEALLDGRRSLLFVPYALADPDGYTAQVRGFFEPLGVRVTGAHESEPARAAAAAEAVFIGGGNTFRLIKALHELALVDAIRNAVRRGAPFLGSSAGTNVATPSIRTTNDMPIVQPPSFEALALVPFQINPHYLDPDPASTHQGETREERLAQFLEENDVPVLGMREGTWLSVTDDSCVLGGSAVGARLFTRGAAPEEIDAGAVLTRLLDTRPAFDAGIVTRQ